MMMRNRYPISTFVFAVCLALLVQSTVNAGSVGGGSDLSRSPEIVASNLNPWSGVSIVSGVRQNRLVAASRQVSVDVVTSEAQSCSRSFCVTRGLENDDVRLPASDATCLLRGRSPPACSVALP